MVTLPQELIHAVTDYVSSTADLRTLREVSRTFKALAEPRAFRVVHFAIHATSVQGLNNIHESDTLRHFVEEVVFRYGDIELVGPEPEKAVMEEIEGDDEWRCAKMQWQEQMDNEEVSDTGSMGESEDEHYESEGSGEDESDSVHSGLRLTGPEERRRILEDHQQEQMELKGRLS
jgi:hypothetical protein